MSEFLRGISAQADAVAQSNKNKVILPEGINTTDPSDKRVFLAAMKLKEKGFEPIMVVPAGSDISEMQAAGLTCVPIEESRAQALAQELMTIRAHKVGTKDELTQQEADVYAHDPLMYGMYLLRKGEAHGLVAGAVYETSKVINAGLWLIEKEQNIKTISSSFYMILPPFRGGTEEVLTFADCAVVQHPTAEQLADIAIAAADARKTYVKDEPRVAFLSSSTHGSGGDKSPSILLVRQALELVRQKRPDIKVEGELQGDAALIQSVSERKTKSTGIGHGQANVLIFPNLDAGNIGYKLVAALVKDAKAIGPILQGFAKPVNDMSRGVTTEGVVDIAMMTMAQVK